MHAACDYVCVCACVRTCNRAFIARVCLRQMSTYATYVYVTSV